MKASQVIQLIQTLAPDEIEKLFVRIKEYESEVRLRQAKTRYATIEEVESLTDTIFSENKELLQKLAEYKKREREESAHKDTNG